MRGFLAAALVVLAVSARAETVRWFNTFDYYGDDVESFTPYRIDGTFLAGQYKTWLDVQPATGTHFLAGVFMEHLSGSTLFADRVMPILSWRYHTEHSTFVLGSLETNYRHGLIEPLSVPQLDFLRPMEYGAQWLAKDDNYNVDLFVDWSQILKVGSQREQFHYGGVVTHKVAGPMWFEYQTLSFHQGGELAGVGEVANNFLGGPGVVFKGDLGKLGASKLAVYRLFDHDGFYGQSINGRAVFVKGTVTPWKGTQLLASYFHGHNYISADGDQNYNSIGWDNAVPNVTDPYYSGSPANFGVLDAVFTPNRDVEELSLIKKIPLNDYSSFEFEEHNQQVGKDFAWWIRFVGKLRFDRVLWQ